MKLFDKIKKWWASDNTPGNRILNTVIDLMKNRTDVWDVIQDDNSSIRIWQGRVYCQAEVNGVLIEVWYDYDSAGPRHPRNYQVRTLRIDGEDVLNVIRPHKHRRLEEVGKETILKKLPSKLDATLNKLSLLESK